MPEKFEIPILLEDVRAEIYRDGDGVWHRYYTARVQINSPIRTRIEIHPGHDWFDHIDAIAAKRLGVSERRDAR
jgi:hypothetical protein